MFHSFLWLADVILVLDLKQHFCVIFKCSACTGYRGLCFIHLVPDIANVACVCYVTCVCYTSSENFIEDKTIIIASLNAIWKAKVMIDGSLQIDRLFGGKSLVAVFVDEKTNLLYWSDVDASIIFRGDLHGTKQEIFMRWARRLDFLLSKYNTKDF